MLFHELYGSYYRTIAELMRLACDHPLTRKEIADVVSKNGFGDSLLRIPQALRSGEWPLLREDGSAVLHHPPTMPLTLLERRWLKALLLDPRIRLFDPPTQGLEDVAPLFTPDTLEYYDQCADGDPYKDEGYIARFRLILACMRSCTSVRLRYQNQHGRTSEIIGLPVKLEYSLKDDKFRLLCRCGRQIRTLNLARMVDAQACPDVGVLADAQDAQPVRATLVCEITDERNALERTMMHFSPMEKETERIGENTYRMTLRYDPADETEILIRVLSFGPRMRVVAPARFADRVKARLSRQAAFFAAQKEDALPSDG